MTGKKVGSTLTAAAPGDCVPRPRAGSLVRAISRLAGVPPAGTRTRITQRRITVTLGLLWLMDGALQLQPGMLTRAFAAKVIAPAASGQPGFVSWPVGEAARAILHQPAAFDVAFFFMQAALGAGMLYRRTARFALLGSVAWALAVWYLGEGLGELFGGGQTLLTGAPGAALLYAVIALILLPGYAGAAAGRRPSRWAAPAWAAVWILGAVLQLLPGSDTNDLLGAMLQMSAHSAPALLSQLDNYLALRVPYTGVSLVVDLAMLQALIGIGVLGGRRMRRAAIAAGICLSIAFWMTGQDLGGLWSGLGTDPGTAPLLAILGITVAGESISTEKAATGDANSSRVIGISLE